MKIAIISGSPRPNSNTLRFSKFIQHILQESGDHDITLVDFAHYDLPYAGAAWLKPDSLTAFQQEFITAWGEADLVFFASPEYNWTANPQVINAFNMLGGPAFKHLFENKVFAMAGTSSGRGGRQPALDMSTVLSKVISFTNSYSVVSPKIYESHDTAKNLDEQGHFVGDEIYNTTTRAFVDYTLAVAQRWNEGAMVKE